MKKLFFIFPILIVVTACAASGLKYNNSVKNKIKDDFYKKTRFIMSKNEKEIYKHLPDVKSKREFVKEFWEKRDPTPDNGENEALMIYNERIVYSNRWFREGSVKNSGWETERGRILLQLGIPDRREFGEMPYLRRDGSLASTKRLPMERWYYYRYKLYLVFTDKNGFGKFKLASFPASLLTAVELAKISVLDNSKKPSSVFKFSCNVKAENMVINIPTKRINFEEDGSLVKASFKFRIYKYLNYKKAGVIKVKKDLKERSDSVLTKNKITFRIPLEITTEGKYFFDIVGEDILAKSKSRSFCKAKIKF